MRDCNVIYGKMNAKERVLFRKEVKKKMIDIDMNCKTLAGLVDYSYKTVSNALGSEGLLSSNLAMAIAEALDLNLREIRERASEL